MYNCIRGVFGIGDDALSKCRFGSSFDGCCYLRGHKSVCASGIKRQGIVFLEMVRVFFPEQVLLVDVLCKQ